MNRGILPSTVVSRYAWPSLRLDRGTALPYCSVPMCYDGNTNSIKPGPLFGKTDSLDPSWDTSGSLEPKVGERWKHNDLLTATETHAG